MDRSKWEYKKLGDCFVSIGNGATIKQIKEAMGIPITRIETLSNDVFNRDRMGYANIEDATPYSSYILNDGDILMSHINSMKFLGRAVEYKKLDNEVIIHGMNLLRLVPTSDFLSSYAVYQFQTDSFRKQIKAISHQAVNQASFNVTNLKRLNVIVPPISDQQRIVAELDCLNEMIAVKQEQLKEFDKLAQSIFYDMFGDPMANEKGWIEEKMGNVCSFSQGVQVDLEKQTLNPKDGFQRFIRISDFTTTDCELRYVKDVDRKYHIDIDDIAIVRYGASAGFVCWGLKGVLANNLFKLNHDKAKLNTIFLVQQLSTNYYKSFIKAEAFGVAMPALSFKSLKHFKIILPPLALQQQFAEKISAIEAQKELVKQSIAETQALLDYTMDKYFG